MRDLMMKVNTARYVVMGEKGAPSSSEKTQGRGLRTGDPLAPVKFILLMAWVTEGAHVRT